MFNASIPATDEAFFDREGELERLADAIDSLIAGRPRWVCILGSRKIGKTSVVLELVRRRASPRLGFVCIDAFERLPVSVEIFRRFAVRSLDVALGSELGRSLEAAGSPSAFRTATEGSSRFRALPADLRSAILDLPDLRLDEDGLRFVLNLPERLAECLRRPLVVAWDEFQEVLTADVRKEIELAPLLRSIWQKHRKVSYVISGSARTMLEELVTRRDSPFFQHFAILDLGPLPRAEAIRLLVETAPPGRQIPLAVAEEAATLLGGHPFYLQLLGEELTAGGTSGPVSSLRDALGQLLFSSAGRLSLYFENEFRRLVGRATTLAATLQALCEGPRRLSEIARAMGAPSGAAAGYVERLGDAVRRGGDGLYRLADPTFGLWLRWRSPGGTVFPTTLLGNEAETHVAQTLAALGFDLIYQSRASRGAFDLLATRGPHQMGIQVKRAPLPLRLSWTSWKRMEADAKRLGWRWVVAAVSPQPAEDVVFFDPTLASRGRTVSLSETARIDNLLRWVDERPEPPVASPRLPGRALEGCGTGKRKSRTRGAGGVGAGRAGLGAKGRAALAHAKRT